MKHLLFFVFAIFMLSGCDNSKKQIEALKTATDNAHDAAMKDMGEMNRVARDIKQFMISATMTPEQSTNYANTLKAIGDAENEMMSWMANYKEPTDKPAAEALKYLQEQKTAIEKNHAAIKAATEAGKKLLPQ